MKKGKRNIIEIQKEVKIPQKDETIFLEKGDKIEVLKEYKEIPRDIIEAIQSYVFDDNDGDSWAGGMDFAAGIIYYVKKAGVNPHEFAQGMISSLEDESPR